MKNWIRPFEMLIEIVAVVWLLETILRPKDSRELSHGKAA